MTSFDIVIPSYGRPDALYKALEAIRTNEQPATLQKLIIVENGGRWGVEKICQSFIKDLQIEVMHSHLANLSNARNIGVANSSADIVLFLDNDVKVVPGALMAYAKAFNELGQRCFYGGPLYPEYEVPPPTWLKDFLPSSVRGHYLGDCDRFIEEPLFLGGNLALPREALRIDSGFEGPCAKGDNGGGVGEETRLQERLVKLGFRGRYVAGAGIIHPVPACNSNVAFVLHRRYRHAYSEGFLDAEKGIYKNLWASAPRFYWRCLLVSLIRLPLSLSSAKTNARRLQYRIKYHEAKGKIAGFREALKIKTE